MNESTENADNSPETEQARKAKAAESQKIDPSQIPPADFALMISMFSTQAMSALGLLPNPITGKPDSQPALAKHYIEMLGILEVKTKGNLDEEEQKLMDVSLHELRMIYMQKTSEE